jgi:hypothetical protein
MKLSGVAMISDGARKTGGAARRTGSSFNPAGGVAVSTERRRGEESASKIVAVSAKAKWHRNGENIENGALFYYGDVATRAALRRGIGMAKQRARDITTLMALAAAAWHV